MKVFHKATLGGLIALLCNPSEEIVCGSTERNSHKLFCRNYALVFEIEEKDILGYNENDMDSRTETPWDECRFDIKRAKLTSIIGSKRFSVTAEDLTHLANNGFKYEFTGDHDKDLTRAVKGVFKRLNITAVRNSGYSKAFLNI